MTKLGILLFAIPSFKSVRIVSSDFYTINVIEVLVNAMVDRPSVGISTYNAYSHRCNLFKNMFKSQGGTIDQNALHLPKPR